MQSFEGFALGSANEALEEMNIANGVVCGQRNRTHRAIKLITRPMLGLKSFWAVRIIIGGFVTMHMIKKVQMDGPDGPPPSE
jgi:hypothetical protein